MLWVMRGMGLVLCIVNIEKMHPMQHEDLDIAIYIDLS